MVITNGGTQGNGAGVPNKENYRGKAWRWQEAVPGRGTADWQ